MRAFKNAVPHQCPHMTMPTNDLSLWATNPVHSTSYLSASSRTRMRTLSPRIASAMSSATSRPGVPHATSHFATAASSAFIRVPPIKAPTLTERKCPPMVRQTAAVCSAISRVGETRSACGPPRPAATPSSATTAKAAVLPVPDFALAMRSMPKRPSGIEAAWMGEGRRKPASRSPWTTESLSPRSQNSGSSSSSTSVVRRIGRPAPRLGGMRRAAPRDGGRPLFYLCSRATDLELGPRTSQGAASSLDNTITVRGGIREAGVAS
eukprot:scaffold220618_cov36-Tisochrysis_lutea.AAC.1